MSFPPPPRSSGTARTCLLVPRDKCRRTAALCRHLWFIVCILNLSFTNPRRLRFTCPRARGPFLRPARISLIFSPWLFPPLPNFLNHVSDLKVNGLGAGATLPPPQVFQNRFFPSFLSGVFPVSALVCTKLAMINGEHYPERLFPCVVSSPSDVTSFGVRSKQLHAEPSGLSGR